MGEEIEGRGRGGGLGGWVPGGGLVGEKTERRDGEGEMKSGGEI